ncbi:hypothetical protein GWI33_017951 [Rhynchophorus ferrugineus]|uniref:Uncharacterized protein n=1 Tax=Rhynchophorus ferrugineus TaxID=354439 RepID=A0A834HUE9_RHYFE|nr:hypothetical protein GWI33_017951 [Rhynchophorus ferrugineus]
MNFDHLEYKNKLSLICQPRFKLSTDKRNFLRVKNTSTMYNNIFNDQTDFSNMKYLNPTITDFIITDESGDYKHWKYTTVYNENLSHWPYLPNYSTAQFEIRSEPEKEEYLIDSFHKTCMFNGFYCLNSISEFKFKRSNKGALCTETVIYECPRVFSSFCRREVEFQREAIIINLKNRFNNL